MTSGSAALIMLRTPGRRVEVAVRVHSSAGEFMLTCRVAGAAQVSPIWVCPVKPQAAP